MSEIEIKRISDSPAIRLALSEMIVEVVANGGSVNFMHPFSMEAADAFWDGWLASAALGDRVVLGAFEGEQLVGTVTLLLKFPPNQPHRAEIGKMMTRISHRKRGIATALLNGAERLAIEHGKTLLVLDTASEDGASGLYERVGFTFAGEIPEFALKPHGGLTGAKFYWKRLQSEL